MKISSDTPQVFLDKLPAHVILQIIKQLPKEEWTQLFLVSPLLKNLANNSLFTNFFFPQKSKAQTAIPGRNYDFEYFLNCRNREEQNFYQYDTSEHCKGLGEFIQEPYGMILM